MIGSYLAHVLCSAGNDVISAKYETAADEKGFLVNRKKNGEDKHNGL